MIVVTGGGGFIGSNLVAHLTRHQNGPIVVCDRFESGQKWRNLAAHPVHAVILPSDLLSWLSALKMPPEAIFHLGAISTTTETDVDALLATNLTFSQALWTYCTEMKIPFIYASSAATYGNGAHGFQDDNSLDALTALRPLNPYGWSKQLFDIFAVREAGRGQAPPFWAGLKFFNVYGPNEYHKGGQRSVAHQLFEQIRDHKSVSLFKSHHPDYGDGGQLRDFVWVDDCVRMMRWLYKTGTQSGIYNCGSGQARSFKDLALAVFKAMEGEPDISYIETPPAIRQHYQYFTEADMSRIVDAGYTAAATSLEEGIRLYIQEYLQQEIPYR